MKARKQKRSGMTTFRRNVVRKEIERRRGILVDQIRSVAQQYTSALFIWGPGGLGKTHITCETLDGLCGTLWVHHTAYSTPKALFMSLADARENVHLFEDCEKLYKIDVAASILRAACAAPRGKPRRITYETANESLSVNFTGGIIINSNEDLSRTKGVLQAVASRFSPQKWDLTIEERICLILDMADRGHERGEIKLTPDECREVARFVVDEMTVQMTGNALDLRMYSEHAIPAFAQAKNNDCISSWKEIVRAKLEGSINLEVPRGDRTRKLEDYALSIHNDIEFPTLKDKMERWGRNTGLGQAIYYRHLKAAQLRERTKPSIDKPA